MKLTWTGERPCDLGGAEIQPGTTIELEDEFAERLVASTSGWKKGEKARPARRRQGKDAPGTKGD